VRPGALEIRAGTTGAPARRQVTSVTQATDLTAKIALGDLVPATRYAVDVSQGEARAHAEFVTAPAADANARVTFLWSGDLGGGGFCRPLDGGYRIFTPMQARRADFFLFVGDTIYADVPCDRPGTVPGANFRAHTVAQYRARHLYNRLDPGLQALLRTTSVYAIWDDHEVRNDFSGPTDSLMPIGRQALLDYWPIAPPSEEPTRLYRRFRWGRLLELFILDTRQYRSDNSQTDGPGKTMLGAEQKRWLLEAVPASTALWKVVVSSVSLSVPTGRPERRDSWTGANVFGLPQDGAGFATERDAILGRFRARGVKNLIFIAADVHHAELIRHHPYHDWSFHEFIAGPLSATLGRPRPLDASLNPRSLFAQGGVLNFGEVTVERESLTVKIVDDGGVQLFTHTIGPE
jgi:alkaline phosphatase D